ncbi:MAG: cobalamin-binding protein [Verrucomicrobiia bacterium]|jgi:iron complex transport system substrate-binding protein
MARHRIVSLLPSATEIICGLGCADGLVGRSHECDFPAEISDVPICTRSKVDPNATSANIDAAVKALIEKSEPLFEIDGKLLRELNPEIIISQSQCDVCAVSDQDVAALISKWPGNRPQVVSLNASKFAHLWDDIGQVAAALQAKEEGKEYIKELKVRVADVIEGACQTVTRPRVLCLEWLEPLMSAGNWVPDMVSIAGGDNLISTSGEHSGWLTMEEVVAAKPDVIVMMPCGFGLEQTRREAETLSNDPNWQKLKAVKRGQVYAVDGSSYFNRPGPRLIDSLEMLAAMIHSGRQDFGHEGTAWLRIQ